MFKRNSCNKNVFSDWQYVENICGNITAIIKNNAKKVKMYYAQNNCRTFTDMTAILKTSARIESTTNAGY